MLSSVYLFDIIIPDMSAAVPRMRQDSTGRQYRFRRIVAMNYFEENLLPEERGAIRYIPTVPQLIDIMVEKYGNNPALSEMGRTVTYSELVKEIAKKRALDALRILKPGAHVGIMALNSIDQVECFLAVMSAGMVAVMLPASLDAESLKNCVKSMDVELLLVGEQFLQIASTAGVHYVPISFSGDWEAPAAEVDKKTPAAIFFTGGTTGRPKGAVLNHGALMRGSYNGTFRRGTVFGQTLIAVLPMNHVFGMIFSMMSILYAGNHAWCCPQPKALFSMMPLAKPTTLILVPGLAEVLLGVIRGKGLEVTGGNLTQVICGGAPVPPKLVRGFREFGITLNPGYGLTETANLVSANYDIDKYPASVGMPYPEQEHKVVDGELWVRGDLLFDGYYGMPEATAAVMQDGWLKTGDLVHVDKDGRITIGGRIKNLIILSNGENVSPEEVEEVFYRSDLIHDCIARESEMNGLPIIELEVLPEPGVDPIQLQRELDRLNALLPEHMKISRFKTRSEEFRKSAALKILRD